MNGDYTLNRQKPLLPRPHIEISSTAGGPKKQIANFDPICPVYFRMLLVGYFEGIGSQRGIAWRCADSLSLRRFLGVPLNEDTPEHSSLTRVRDRLPLEVHACVFRFVLSIAAEKGLLRGKTVAVDATTLEANAAMKSIVRRDSLENWDDYLRRLMKEEGYEDPTAEELRNFDKKRTGKKVSNQEWMSPTDPDSRIAKMKDGRTHLAYKAEHVIDVETELVLGASIRHADEGDPQTLVDSVLEAQIHLDEAGVDAEIKEVVADKGNARAQFAMAIRRQRELHQMSQKQLGQAVGVPSPRRRFGSDHVGLEVPIRNGDLRAPHERVESTPAAGAQAKKIEQLQAKFQRVKAHSSINYRVDLGGGTEQRLRVVDAPA